MQLIDSDKLSQASVDDESFPFFYVENVFLDKVNSELVINDFPDISNGGSYHINSIPSGNSIKQLVDDLESTKFKGILETKFNLNLDEAKVATTLRGYCRKKDGTIHKDSKTKILTVLLYLNQSWPSNTGNLRLLRGDNSLEDYIKEIPSTFGSLVAFKVTDKCWHGFKSYEGKRLSMQLNYIYPSALRSHNLRHKLSSGLKSIFRKTL